MRTALQVVEVAALAAISFLAIEAGLLVRQARLSLPSLVASLQSTLADYQRLSQDATGVTAEIRKALKANQDASKAVIENSRRATAELTTDLGTLNSALGGLDELIIGLDRNREDLGARAGDTLEKINLAADEVGPIFDHLNVVTASAAVELPPAMEKLSETATSTEAIAADGRTASDLALVRFREMMKPPKLALRLAELVGGHFVEALEGVYYWKHLGDKE